MGTSYTSTLPWGCGISIRWYIWEDSFIWRRKMLTFDDQSRRISFELLHSPSYLHHPVSLLSLSVFWGCRSHFHSNTVNSWTVGHSFEHTVCITWFVTHSRWERFCTKLITWREQFITRKCSTWLVWVNFGIGLNIPGRTSQRIEPLEAALSQVLAKSCSEVKSHQREREAAE